LKRNRIIVVLLVAGVAAGGIAYRVLRDDGGGGGGRAEKSEGGGRGARRTEGAPFEGSGLASGGGAFAAGGTAALSPEEEKRIREVLEKLGNETAIRQAFTAGVAEPWPLPASQRLFDSCMPLVERGIPPGSSTDPGAICACAIRAMQEVYPREPPQPRKGNAIRMVKESYRTAIAECLNP
jgi:hypothetical protein